MTYLPQGYGGGGSDYEFTAPVSVDHGYGWGDDTRLHSTPLDSNIYRNTTGKPLLVIIYAGSYNRKSDPITNEHIQAVFFGEIVDILANINIGDGVHSKKFYSNIDYEFNLTAGTMFSFTQSQPIIMVVPDNWYYRVFYEDALYDPEFWIDDWYEIPLG
jgi:hypothetical protein